MPDEDVANAKYFDGEGATGTYLSARGFDEKGNRSGGIKGPKKVTLPAGTILFRFYHQPRSKHGQWWATPHELARVIDYFAREGPALAEGRSAGRGILHATFVVRHDWGSNSPDHLGRFWIARVKSPLWAYYGEGDEAPDESKKQVQKAVKILGKGGAQIGVNQVYLPKLWEYASSLEEIADEWTDAGLSSAVRAHVRQKLDFEL